MRTCVGCREVAARTALLRVVAESDDDGQWHVAADPHKRRAGRGAWLHPDPACLDLAVRRKAFGRALRAEVAVDAPALRAWVEEQAASRSRSVDTPSSPLPAPSENRKRV
ncbi:YlxR family protein [Arsenicicoccus sp. oral taxon 190]|uniref:YlxR family protein n=1 Tax=Arsenicicoccus sp. oral taxon 190 TaxID=1658671 RepID=UPI00067A0E49|nr:YlxR family protein [Arsenicicoccus sp. oral taxon 190]AKT51555.1 hypothetical protein ADJ73_10030 [Arsenicicoccus sp. oral taxon 190]